jgi:GDP-L-fucose synthase
MKILITGGSGMVGRNLIEFFEKKSEYTLFYPSSRELNLLQSDKVTSYLKEKAPDVIIHCAGLVGGIQANIKKPFSFLSNNLLMGSNLIHGAIELGIKKFINMGSSCMYPKDRLEPLREEDILSGPLEPTNEGYAISKITTSKLCEYAGIQFGLKFKTIIPCNLYGKYDKFDPVNSHMIPAVIRKLHQAKKDNSIAEIWGDGTARREFMFAEDLADFVGHSLKYYDDLEDYTNVGLGYDYSVLEYYQHIAKVVGYKGEFYFNTSKPVGMKRKLCSIEKQKALGWEPKHSLREGLEKTNEFFISTYGI